MTAIILCVITVVEGLLLLGIDFFAFVYQKITVGVSLCWGGFALILVMLGAVPGLSAWSRAVPAEAVPAFFLISISAVFSVFYLSCAVSQLLRKNQELAMHVSLLNQENETILQKLKEAQEREACRGKEGSENTASEDIGE